jgi:SAM-dependent methyltransferase
MELLAPMTDQSQELSGEFRLVRNTLIEARFTEDSICERCRVRDFSKVGPTLQDIRSPAQRDQLDYLIDLFVLEDSAKVDDLMAHGFPEETLRAFERIGLVRYFPHGPGMVSGAASLRPIGSNFLACDRRLPLSSAFKERDRVLDPLSPETRGFGQTLPIRKCDTFLELCAGSGVAALFAARHFSRRAWACDITERAVQFASFNARLNAIENIVLLQGDLYEPVDGLKFDYIAAHPPYVPAITNSVVFRDGGIDGEIITKRILAGLPQYLNRGGWFYARALVTDREAGSFESRVRELLGTSACDFDVLTLADKSTSPTEYLSRFDPNKTKGRSLTATESEALSASFSELGILRFFMASIILQRAARPRRVFVSRHKAGASLIKQLIEAETKLVEQDIACPHA